MVQDKSSKSVPAPDQPSRVAHRAFEVGKRRIGRAAMTKKPLWQFTVAIRSDPAGPQQQAIDNENDYWLKNEDGLLIGYDPKKYIMLLSRLQLMKKICRLVQF